MHETEDPVLGGYFRVTATPLFDQTGQLRGSIQVAHDITDRKRAEEHRLASTERQRDLLVREVHHRIKNHLQGLVGLLSHERGVKPDCEESIDRALTQVQSIASVYGLQSHSAGSEVCVAELLQAIVAGARAYSSIALMQDVSDPSDADPMKSCIHGKKAVAVALVINELLLNALKHIPRSGRDIGVRVSLVRQPDRLVLTISHPGALPEDFDFEAGRGLGTGLELIRDLLPRAGAKLVIAGCNGTVTAALDLSAPLLVETTGAG